MRLHALLHRRADVAQAHVDARGGDAHVGRLLDGVCERVELRVEVHGPSAVDDPTVDVRAW